VSTTVTCTNAWLDCQGDGVPDPSCTFTGDTVGDLGQQPPVDTWVELAAGPIGVSFACGEAKVTPSTACSSDADCVPGSSCLFDGTCQNIVVPLDPLTDCLLLPVDP
jgi:hypothetical protein